jgi:hypothetical protein
MESRQELKVGDVVCLAPRGGASGAAASISGRQGVRMGQADLGAVRTCLERF